MGRKIITIIQWLLALALVAALIFMSGDLSQFLRLPKLHWGFLWVVFFSTVVFSLVHNVRWLLIVRTLSGRGPTGVGNFLQLYRWLVNSYAVGMFVPMDVSLLGMRTFYMSRFGAQAASEAVFSVLFDRFLDLAVFLLLIVPTLVFISGTESRMPAVVLTLLAGAGAFVLAGVEKTNAARLGVSFYNRLLVWAGKLPFLARRGGTGGVMIPEGVSFSGPVMMELLALSCLKYLCLAVRFYVIGMALDVPFSFFQAFFLVPFVQMASLINVTPGGLGVVEFGSYGALALMGIAESKILLFVIGQRVTVSLSYILLAIVVNPVVLVADRLKGQTIR
jgi:uncharacterized membrane protein YbhN (UPF0104 family)